MEDLVSLIIPVYNVEKYIDKCIKEEVLFYDTKKDSLLLVWRTCITR